MSDDSASKKPGFGDLESPFLFVPHGAPEPTEWMRKHPGWVKFPATFVPRAPAAVRTIPGTNRPWPLDKRGQPWPRSRFGQPLRPLDEYPPGVRAPGEGYTGPIADPDKAVRAALASGEVLAQAARYAADPDAPIRAYLSARDVWQNPGKYAGYPRPQVPAATATEPASTPPSNPSAAPEVMRVNSTLLQGALGAVLLGGAALEARRAQTAPRRRAPDSTPPASVHPPGIGGPADVLPGVIPEALGDGGGVAPAPKSLQPPPGFTPLSDEGKRVLDRPESYPVNEGTDEAVEPGDFRPTAPSPNGIPESPAAGPGVAGTDIFTRDEERNKGLEDHPELRTRGSRVRANSAKADPEVVDALGTSPWQGHHLIPVQVIKEYLDLFGPASEAEGGFRTDEVDNMVPLPANEAGQNALQERGINRPIHRSGHKDWSEEVGAELKEIKDKLQQEGLTPENPLYGVRANELIRELEFKLRREVVRSGKLTENDAVAVPQDGVLNG